MEGVSEARHEHLSAAAYLSDRGDQLFSFVLSFALIAGAWVTHHRTFDQVGRLDGRLVLLNLAWLLTIVWLPVVTAMSGSLHTDRGLLAIYIGGMLANQLVMLVIAARLWRHPELLAPGRQPTARGVGALTGVVVLMTVALAIAVAVPAVGYYALFVLFASGLVGRPIARRLQQRSHRQGGAAA